jgi:hypothetical protein
VWSVVKGLFDGVGGLVDWIGDGGLRWWLD